MEIRPFKAFRYDQLRVGDVGSCIAPPYDVISPEQQEQLYNNNDYNIVRIIKGKESDSDNDSNNQYTRAAEYLKTWIKQGVLKQDKDQAIYPYIQDFELAGAEFQRISFIAQAKLEDFGKVVRPHEMILQKPLVDRLNLKKATSAGFGLVFMLYEDPEHIADGVIEKSINCMPLIDFNDEQNVRHRLFVINNRNGIDAIVNMMNDKSCIIADGHHRYTTGLQYAQQSKNPNAQYQMMVFVNTCQQGLVVLATHRLVNNLDGFNLDKLTKQLKENFTLTAFRFDTPDSKISAKEKMLAKMKAEYHKDKNAFGIYAKDSAFYLAVLKKSKVMDSVVPDKSSPWRSLDVAVLHKLILEKLLGIDEQKLAGGTDVEYIKDTPNAIDDSIDKVDRGLKQAVFFMNPTKIQQIQAVAEQGERMPQKSTYFFPKMFTGLTIEKL